MSKANTGQGSLFAEMSKRERGFAEHPRALVGHIPTIAITPVADGRTGAHEANAAGTWRMVVGRDAEWSEQRVYRGEVDTPKSIHSVRWAALSDGLVARIQQWRSMASSRRPSCSTRRW